MSRPATVIASGFADPTTDAQRAFRAILDAMARPGRIVDIPGSPDAPPPLQPAAGALALTLFDFETPIWLDPSIRAADDVREYLRFHCGCPLVDQPDHARFAIIADGASMLPLSAFDSGTPEYPDRSTTVIVQVKSLQPTEGVRLTGPGIAGEERLRIEGLHQQFWQWSRGVHAVFPCGVDVVFVTGTLIAALPRSTWVEE